MSTPVLRDLAGRFVGGDDLPAGLRAVRGLNDRGIKGSLNFHGMHVREEALARSAAAQATEALARIQAEGLDSHVSIKLTKIGLDLDPALCRAHLERILGCAAATGGFVRIDMEESVYLDPTLDLFEEALARHGAATVGLVLQSYLRNRSGDLDRLLDLGASVRLVKGGYREPGSVVYQEAADIDAAFLKDIERLLQRGVAPAIATHDPAAIAWTKTVQEGLGLGKEALEFQMLYGVKPDLQHALVAEGSAVRCYVPYGGDWAAHLAGCLRRLPASLLRRGRTP